MRLTRGYDLKLWITQLARRRGAASSPKSRTSCRPSMPAMQQRACRASWTTSPAGANRLSLLYEVCRNGARTTVVAGLAAEVDAYLAELPGEPDAS